MHRVIFYISNQLSLIFITFFFRKSKSWSQFTDMHLLFLVGSGTQVFQTAHTNKIANGFEPRPHSWKLSALSTAPSLLPRPVEHLPPWSDLRIGPHSTKLLLYPLKFSLSQRIKQRKAPFLIFIFTTFTLVHHHFFSVIIQFWQYLSFKNMWFS